MKPISRRFFLSAGAAGAISFCLSPGAATFSLFGDKENNRKIPGPADIRGEIFKNDVPVEPWQWSREAFFYRSTTSAQTSCTLCPNGCLLTPGDRGICRSRVNIKGTLYSLAYGNPCAVHIDPVEKKPLFHFKPGSGTFSIAATGCNFRCLNCQNWEISQSRPEDVRRYSLSPAEVVNNAIAAGTESIAYTYSEATTWFEYMYDTAELANRAGIRNIWVSNGYINPEPLKQLCGVIHAANIDLKAFSDDLYRRLCGGRLGPVLETLQTLNETGVHFEITCLIVPGYTDDPRMVKAMCRWIVDHLGPDHPLHFSRFVPQYKLKRLPPTPVTTLTGFRETALAEGMRYVYVGNVPGHEGESTYCHNCGKSVVERAGYRIGNIHIDNGKCEFCGTVIPGVFQAGHIAPYRHAGLDPAIQ